jgi:hypothetical protein
MEVGQGPIGAVAPKKKNEVSGYKMDEMCNMCR